MHKLDAGMETLLSVGRHCRHIQRRCWGVWRKRVRITETLCRAWSTSMRQTARDMSSEINGERERGRRRGRSEIEGEGEKKKGRERERVMGSGESWYAREGELGLCCILSQRLTPRTICAGEVEEKTRGEMRRGRGGR